MSSATLLAVAAFSVLFAASAGQSSQLYGCNNDVTLCTVEETCINDGLFGECWPVGEVLIAEPPATAYLDDGRMRTLQLELNGLIARGLRWRQPEVQCVVAYFLLTAKYALPYDDSFCHVRRPESLWTLFKVIQNNLHGEPASGQSPQAVYEEPGVVYDNSIGPVYDEVVQPVPFDYIGGQEVLEPPSPEYIDVPVEPEVFEVPVDDAIIPQIERINEPDYDTSGYPVSQPIDAIQDMTDYDGEGPPVAMVLVPGDGPAQMRGNILTDIVNELASDDGQIEKRSSGALDAGGAVADEMTMRERVVLEDWLRRQMDDQPINLSEISDEQLDKYIAIVRLMKNELESMLNEGETEGELEEAINNDQLNGREVNLLKKDTERLGDLNLGLPAQHKIVKGIPKGESDVEVEHMFHRIDGNRVYIRLKQNVTTNSAKLLELLAFLEETIAQPKNLTFTDFAIDPNEISFRVSSTLDPDADWLNKLFNGAPPTPSNDRLFAAEAVADTVFNKRSDVAHFAGADVYETGVGDGREALATHGGAAGGGVASDSLRLGILMTCGVLAVVLVGVLGAAYVARTNHRAISVVKRVSADIEGKASKAYEELCRQRMAGGRTADGADSGPISSVINTINQRLGSQSGGDNQSPTNRSSTSSWSEEPLQTTDMDVTTGHAILRYLEEQLADQGKLDADWKALEAYQPDQVDTNIALKQDNRSKNRYPDVLPYDHALVSLRSESAMIDLGGQGVEYINASPLCDHDPQNPIYIAAQAPLVSTAAEFWQMIWEQGSVVVVNLTQLNGENGDALCHRYWPDNGSEVHGIFEVHLVSEHIWCEDYLVRSFYLKNMRTNETRTVTQFHFLSWRDNSVPPNTKSLLEFRSDGAGRTGTYCLLDMILNRINKGVKEMDAAATLEHLRDQRMRLVRTKAQYELVLACIAEEVNAMLKAL